MKKLLLLAVLSACGGRPAEYDAPVNVQTFGLASDVALVDDGAHRVLVLTPRADQELDRTSIPVGKGVVRSIASADGKHLFVLSTGELVRKKTTDERPKLTVIESGGAAPTSRDFPLESPHSGLALDPDGRYLALFADGSGQTTFVENPNEIVVIDLNDGSITPRSIRSFGGRPQRVSFSPNLGGRRLLVVETEQDITLLDLDHVHDTVKRPEVTVRLATGASAAVNPPAGVVFDAGNPARIGVRVQNASNVVTVTIGGPAENAVSADPTMIPNDFTTTLNLTDVGGVPSDLAFVRTDVGTRLAAVVPSARRAVLVDPQTSIVTNVDLGEPYSKLSLVTSAVGSTNDTALLYGAGQGVGFWSLGNEQPYRSVEIVSLSSAVDQAMDVPPPRPELKVLEASSAQAFYVLNLASRTASPLTTLGNANLHISRDGQRVWAFQRGTSQLSAVALGDLHPVPVPLDRPLDSVFDVARADGGRSLVAIDARGTFGATVLDALAPDGATAASYYGLLVEASR